jgi:hypothetical protein
MRTYLIFFFALFITVNLYSQDVNQLREYDLPGIKILNSNSFTYDNLSDYLGGNAALFMEYGCRNIYVTRCLRDKDTVTLEIGEMHSAACAFGIFSITTGQSLQPNPFGSFSCLTPYQAAAASGNLYINATNRTGTSSGMDLCSQLVRLIINKNPMDIWYPPAMIQSEKAAPFSSSFRYFAGPVGVSQVIPSWFEMFKNLSFHMYTINFSTQGFTGILARISFPDQNSLSSFMSGSGMSSMIDYNTPVRTMEGNYRTVYPINNTKVLFLESTSPDVNVRDFVPKVPDGMWMIEE